MLFAIHEIAVAASAQGVLAEGMNIGGRVERNGVAVSLVPALHSSGLGGTAAGAVVQLDGKTLYHAGDTGLTLEMQLIGEMYRPDAAFLPIDGRFTMTPRLAARAVQLLGVKLAVPIHFGTFPAIQSSPEEFQRLCPPTCEVRILQPGQSLEL